ncbi:transcription factor HHO5-like [Primulina eburnea]|uniref:transcription factor HHO5-like n=1 Tax=Primulina eburnea TaxID=1245227 RepID=UPI003C6C3B49
MGEIYKEMNLDGGSTYVPKTIAQILADVSMVGDLAKKASMLGFHIREMEKEISKIEYFKRELPQYMHFLEDATETLKKEMLRWKGQEKGPVMVEFSQTKGNLEGCGGVNGTLDISEKKSWMRSVNLWSTPVHYEEDSFDTNQDSAFHQESSHKGNPGEKLFEGYALKNRGGAFLPYKKPGNNEREVADSVDSMGTSIDLNVIAGDQQLQKQKRRRCWSPELHKRFVDALHQLGGVHEATPKQIKELMKVHGLTNDQVKSHLQKYRLHI